MSGLINTAHVHLLTKKNNGSGFCYVTSKIKNTNSGLNRVVWLLFTEDTVNIYMGKPLK